MLPAVAPTLLAPASYATIPYYGLHAFRWIDASGGERYVRYTLRPAASAPRPNPRAARRLGRNYLQDEIGKRIEAGPVLFSLEVQIAQPGDPVEDPSAAWPKQRRRVTVGTLKINRLEHEREQHGDVLVFDPSRVTDGIECSDDPVLRFRPHAYSESVTTEDLMAAKWTAAEIPDQSGRTVVVTGANSGLGLATARELANAGASVVAACRDLAKGREAFGGDVRRTRSRRPGVGAGVRRSSSATDHDQLDLLINNAGVMAPPRRLTKDGFESQFGTNHLGHFALTGRLLPLLSAAPAPRVVTVSSGMHRSGTIKFDDLQREHGYNNWLAYSQSKLANLVFCFELQRRATAAGSALLSLAAHPGYAATNLQFAGPARAYERWFMAIANKVYAQSAEMGALPTLYAATVPDLPGGTFVGPDGFMEGRGHPKVVTAAGKAYNEDDWRRLWDVSEQLTGVHYES